MKKIFFYTLFVIIFLTTCSNIFSQQINNLNYKWGDNKKVIKKAFTEGTLITENKYLLIYRHIDDRNIFITFIFDDNNKLIAVFLSIKKYPNDVYPNITSFFVIEKYLEKTYDLLYGEFDKDAIVDFINGHKEAIISGYMKNDTYVAHTLKKKNLEYVHDVLFVKTNKIEEILKLKNKINFKVYK